MSAKPIRLSTAASRDADAAVAYYLAQGGPSVALRFVAALEQALGKVAHNPAAGSPRYMHELDLPGLRVWRLRRFPHLVFYVEGQEEIDVWRILHGQRDIPSWLRLPEAEDR